MRATRPLLTVLLLSIVASSLLVAPATASELEVIPVGYTRTWTRDFGSFSTSGDFSSGCSRSPLGMAQQRIEIEPNAVRNTTKPAADCTIYKAFTQGAPNQVWSATAEARIASLNNLVRLADGSYKQVEGAFRARLKIEAWATGGDLDLLALQSGEQLEECFTDLLISTEGMVHMEGEPCVMPPGTDEVRIAFRARQQDVREKTTGQTVARSVAYGVVLLDQLTLTHHTSSIVP